MASGLAANNHVESGAESPEMKLRALLPDDYHHVVLKATEEDDGLFGKIRLPITSKEEALVWVRKFEFKNGCLYRGQKSWFYDPELKICQKKFLCAHQTAPEQLAGPQYDCTSSILISVMSSPAQEYPVQVTLQHKHDHPKSAKAPFDLRLIFSEYFTKGHSPFSALVCHKCDIHSKYGPSFYDMVPKGSVCPSYKWCASEFRGLFHGDFKEPSDLGADLRAFMESYNKKFVSACALWESDSLIICTPLMKSVFHAGFGEDLITLRTFCSGVQKVVLLLCHTPIGSFPFGIIVTSSEDPDLIARGFEGLMRLLNAAHYKPQTIIVDDNSLISACLNKVFPESQLVFNEFQMLQSIWRIIRLVCQGDNEEFQALYEIFFQTLNSVCEEEFLRNVDSLMVYAEKKPKLAEFLTYFKQRSGAYVLYAKPKVDFNTDVLNYTDSGTMLLHDVTVKYSGHFNVVQLFSFITDDYMRHYERKLRKIIAGDLQGYFKTNFFVPLTRLSDFTVQKITDTEFLVCVDELKYFVNAELDTCTCQVGVDGCSCVHQYIVEKTLGLLPECYTPIEEYMTDIFRSILEHQKSLEAPKKPPEASDSLEELPELPYSAGQLDDLNLDCLEDLEHFNKESGELQPLLPQEEPVPEPKQVVEERVFSPVEEFMEPLCISGEELLPLESAEETCEFEEATPEFSSLDFIKNAPIEEILPLKKPEVIQDGTVDSQTDDQIVGLQDSLLEGPIVYSYITEEGEELLLTEGDEKTGVADFLTNPQLASAGGDFSEYHVMEDGLLVAGDAPVQDSFDESMMMVSPNEVLVEEPPLIIKPSSKGKINVLSSVVIKPPQIAPKPVEDAYEIEISQGDPENLITVNSPKIVEVFTKVTPEKAGSPFKISQSQEDFKRMVKELSFKDEEAKRPLTVNNIEQVQPQKTNNLSKPVVFQQPEGVFKFPSPIKIGKTALKMPPPVKIGKNTLKLSPIKMGHIAGTLKVIDSTRKIRGKPKLPPPVKLSNFGGAFGSTPIKTIKIKGEPKLPPPVKTCNFEGTLKLLPKKIEENFKLPSTIKIVKSKVPSPLKICNYDSSQENIQKLKMELPPKLPSSIKVSKVTQNNVKAAKPAISEEVTIQTVKNNQKLQSVSLKDYLAQKKEPQDCEEVHYDLEEDLSSPSEDFYSDEYDDFEEDILSDCDSIVEDALYDCKTAATIKIEVESPRSEEEPVKSVRVEEEEKKRPIDELSFLLDDSRFEMVVDAPEGDSEEAPGKELLEERVPNNIEYVTDDGAPDSVDLTDLLEDLGFQEKLKMDVEVSEFGDQKKKKKSLGGARPLQMVLTQTRKEFIKQKKATSLQRAPTDIRIREKTRVPLQMAPREEFFEQSSKKKSTSLRRAPTESRKELVKEKSRGPMQRAPTETRDEFLQESSKKKSTSLQKVREGLIEEKSRGNKKKNMSVQRAPIKRKEETRGGAKSSTLLQRALSEAKDEFFEETSRETKRKSTPLQRTSIEPVQESLTRSAKKVEETLATPPVNKKKETFFTLDKKGKDLLPPKQDKNTPKSRGKAQVQQKSVTEDLPSLKIEAPSPELRMICPLDSFPIIVHQTRTVRSKVSRLKARLILEKEKKKKKKRLTQNKGAKPIDFETSITAAVLEKSESGPPSVKYEDAFKRFLQTEALNKPPTTIKSLSDTEDLSWEPPKKSRKRCRSLSRGRRKKSVSWCEGLDVLEFRAPAPTDSDDSEVVVAPRKRGRPRKDSKAKKTVTRSPSQAKKTKKKKKRGHPKLELLVLLERDEAIERMCAAWRKRGSPKRGGRRVSKMGYQELLAVARKKKNF